MSNISGVQSQLLQSQIASIQTKNDIGVKTLKKTQDAAELQGEAAIKLLDAATDIAKEGPSLGALASGLGQNLDVSA